MKNSERFPHYYKEVPSTEIDVYRVLLAFQVIDPCLQHAIKKLLVAGARGLKDHHNDIAEAIATLTRYQEMRKEEEDERNPIADLPGELAAVAYGITNSERKGRLADIATAAIEARKRCGPVEAPLRTECCWKPHSPGFDGGICGDCPAADLSGCLSLGS